MKKSRLFVKDGTEQSKQMWKQFTVHGNTQYFGILPKILQQYNNTKHSSIQMSPTEANKK